MKLYLEIIYNNKNKIKACIENEINKHSSQHSVLGVTAAGRHAIMLFEKHNLCFQIIHKKSFLFK
jgi:hypothetical protein